MTDLKILNNRSYSLCLMSHSIILFHSVVFSLFLPSLVFVGLFRIFPSDVVAAMLLLLNKDITPLLVPQTNLRYLNSMFMKIICCDLHNQAKD